MRLVARQGLRRVASGFAEFWLFLTYASDLDDNRRSAFAFTHPRFCPRWNHAQLQWLHSQAGIGAIQEEHMAGTLRLCGLTLFLFLSTRRQEPLTTWILHFLPWCHLCNGGCRFCCLLSCVWHGSARIRLFYLCACLKFVSGGPIVQWWISINNDMSITLLWAAANTKRGQLFISI